MPFFSKAKNQLFAILTFCGPCEQPELQIEAPTDIRRVDYTIEGLTEEQYVDLLQVVILHQFENSIAYLTFNRQAWIHEKALADASYPATPGHRLTRSSLSAISSLPGPTPAPFCENPRKVPPFPVRRCNSSPYPRPHPRHNLPVARSQSFENRLQPYLSSERETCGSTYAPRCRSVTVAPLPQALPRSEESHSSTVSQDLASRPTSLYSQVSRPSSDVLPNAKTIPHIPLPHRPRVDSHYRPLSLSSIPSLPSPPKSRPSSFQPPHFHPVIYDHLVAYEMSANGSDMSLVEPLSFYQAEFDASFLQVAQATMEVKSAWSTRSSLDLEEEGSSDDDDDDSLGEDVHVAFAPPTCGSLAAD
ncbi:hypothetical protein FKW77_007790 [Venturia effusa]|uniref:Uncharacterized protein n=1 Tax=Venturia effusa TaxID=50376 RepID=A0A517LCM9_9PEZI|nr:hypothetical protein FKW77_007790 [Venturia effusa]